MPLPLGRSAGGRGPLLSRQAARVRPRKQRRDLPWL